MDCGTTFFRSVLERKKKKELVCFYAVPYVELLELRLERMKNNEIHPLSSMLLRRQLDD